MSICGLVDISKRAGMEETRFFYQQANWCYQLAWQCFDLTVAYELNVMGNELTARARHRQSQELTEHQTQRTPDADSEHHRS
jgi:hypothetical protein